MFGPGRVRGWERFCEQIGVPAFSCWEFLPGWERFQRLRKAAEHMAYTPDGFVAWLNRIRDPADPELKRIRTADHFAGEATVIYQDRLRWCGGA